MKINSEDVIISRPAGGIWGMLLMMLIFCGCAALIQIFDPPKPDRIWETWFMGGVPGVAASGLLLYLARHRIIADENGLHWRGAFTRWKSARWDEISDFTISRQSKISKTYAVETARGELTFGGSNDTHAEELAAFIAQRAVKTRYREWESKGLRADEEFERVFVVPTISWRAVTLTFLAFVSLGLVTLPHLRPRDYDQWQIARALDAPEVAAWALWAPFVVIVVLASAVATAMIAPIISAREKRECVIVTQRGLRFENGEQTLELGWDELRAVHLHNGRAHFVGARGEWEMDWLLSVRPFIEHHAPAATFDSESESFDLEAPVQLQNGARFYSFRTTGLRMTLRIFAAMTALYMFMPLLMLALVGVAPDDLPRDDPRFFWILAVPFAAFCGWLWRLYRRGGVAIGASGAEVRGAWRNRFYHWDEIEMRDDEIVARRGEKSVKLWSWVSPVRRDELRAEIERRVAQEQPRRAG